MLIDDDVANNYLNKRTIGNLDCTEHIEVAENGQIALELLEKGLKMRHCLPELIFLDINMPAMDGWEFLEEFRKRGPFSSFQVKIIMLTTSLNPADRSKAENIKEISGFINKPLRDSFVKQILNEHFSM